MVARSDTRPCPMCRYGLHGICVRVVFGKCCDGWKVRKDTRKEIKVNCKHENTEELDDDYEVCLDCGTTLILPTVPGEE